MKLCLEMKGKFGHDSLLQVTSGNLLVQEL